MRRRFLGLACLVLVTACATRTGSDGQTQTTFDAKYLAKTDIDRVVDVSRSEVMAGLTRIADKLYRRNPREWKKDGFASREAALLRLAQYRDEVPPQLGARREGPAALQAFNPDYAGDRVAALMYGLFTMVDAAYEHKDEFFILDSLHEQKLYNCARNMEIAVWKLAAARDGDGVAMLLSNEGDPGNRNLSFEREFGRVIGLLDFLSKVVADENGRTVTRVTHSVATSLFLPVGLLK